MKMDYNGVAQKIQADYRSVTAQYRLDDEIEVTTPNHRRLALRLKQICLSFPRPLEALDVGCGTGRYFHCLENVAHLTGIDLSEEMLGAAKRPVLAERITAATVQLLQGNIYFSAFPPDSFDLIYSLGMFGHGCPVTIELCNKFHHWLRPGGKLLFNVVDMAGLPLKYRTRRQLRFFAYPWLTRRWQKALDERENRSPFFAMFKSQLDRILSATHFQSFTVSSHPCESPLGKGRHLECVAGKR